jgi:hypothetical protein
VQVLKEATPYLHPSHLKAAAAVMMEIQMPAEHRMEVLVVVVLQILDTPLEQESPVKVIQEARVSNGVVAVAVALEVQEVSLAQATVQVVLEALAFLQV